MQGEQSALESALYQCKWVIFIMIDVNKKTYMQCSCSKLFPFAQALKLFC